MIMKGKYQNSSGIFASCHYLSGRRFLFVLPKEGNQRVSEIFPSLQVFRHPSIPLRNCSVHVQDIALARPR
jgi:hypothetical protein